MGDVKRSRRGVYYDLTISPYEYRNPYGDIFKFGSQKRLDIYSRDVKGELIRFNNLIARHNLAGFLPDEIIILIYRAIYIAFYKAIER